MNGSQKDVLIHSISSKRMKSFPLTEKQIHTFIATHAKSGCTEETIRQHQAAIKSFYEFLPENKCVLRSSLEHWQEALSEQGYSTRTILARVSAVNTLGVVKNRTAENFDPNAPITRAEFAAICARFDTSKRDGDSNFTDISGHWAEAEIERAASLGWIMGYTDGTFRPENYITRAEAMTMINRVLNRLPEDEDDLLDGMNFWPDNKPGDWYYLAVQEATNSHDFTRKGDAVHEHWTEMTTNPDWSRYQ